MAQKETRNLRMLPVGDDTLLDAVAYSQYVRSEAEDADAYVRRRRTIDLAQLVQQVIEEELTDAQKQAVRLRYYEQRTPTQIAGLLGLSTSNVCKTLDRAEANIRRSLQYVIRYQYDLRNMEVLPCALREAMATAAGRYGGGRDIAERLRNLRTGEAIPQKAAAEGTRIPLARLRDLESGKATPDCGELLKLSAYYDVTTDAILKGVSA